MLAAHLHAATHRLLVLIAEFDRLRGWERAGCRSCAHWRAFRTGFDLGASREKVRAARALESLPETSAAMARGELSFAKVRALTRVGTPENESQLLELARSGTAAQLERVVRSWKWLNREDEAEWERRRHETRCLSLFPGEDGMYVIRGRLDPEVGALLQRAIEAAGDALFRADPEEVPERRRADAIALLAERALAAGFGAQESHESAEVPMSGTRAERYQVMLHVEAPTLEASSEPTMSELEDGTRVSAETCRRLACDAGVVTVRHAPDGRILHVGRRTRTIPPAIRRALNVRDRGCRFPGCGSRFADAHHIRRWADGGVTSLDNTILLCGFHHRLLHEGGYRVELKDWPGGRATFYDARGLPVSERPPAPPKWIENPVDRLVLDNRIEPDPLAATARYKFDEAIAVETHTHVLRALDRSA